MRDSFIRLLGIFLACGIALEGVAGVLAAQNDEYVTYVNTCTESGLNAALYTAQHSEKTEIRFKCDGTIRLTAVKKIIRPITIDATNHKIILDGQHRTSIFEIMSEATSAQFSEPVKLDKLTLINAGVVYDSATGVPLYGGDNGDASPQYAGRAIVNYGQLSIEKSTFANNISAYPFGGGAIDNYGLLQVSDSVFVNNEAGRGFSPSSSGEAGAIENHETAEIYNSTFAQNYADVGAAVVNQGLMTISQSLFVQNQGYGWEYLGGFCSSCGTITNSGMMTIENSTVTNNDSVGFSNSGTVTFINDTLYLNKLADNYSSDIYIVNIVNNGIVTLYNSIIAGTESGRNGAKIALPKDTTSQNSIPKPHTNCLSQWLPAGTPDTRIINGGGNLQYPDNTCGKEIPIANPLLTTLGNYGSTRPQGADDRPVLILGLQPASPAIDAATCITWQWQSEKTYDGRGWVRPWKRNAKCDSGAFEYEAISPEAVPTATPYPTFLPSATVPAGEMGA